MSAFVFISLATFPSSLSLTESQNCLCFLRRVSYIHGNDESRYVIVPALKHSYVATASESSVDVSVTTLTQLYAGCHLNIILYVKYYAK